MNKTHLINLWLDLAEGMISSGAEINRVEDTLTRLAGSFGAVRRDIFVITSSIVMSVAFENGEQCTVSRRIRASAGTDFEKLEALNALSRRCSHSSVSEEEFEREVKRILGKKPSLWKKYVGSVLASGAFGVFFGGNWIDGLLAAVFGAFVCFLTLFLDKIVTNSTILYLVCSALSGISICLIEKVVPGMHIDKVCIGVIMLLIPGIAITNAMRDVLIGDTISGSMKAIQCILWAFMIAGGFLIAMKIVGSHSPEWNAQDGLYQLVPAMIGSLGFATLFNLRNKYLPLTALGGFLCWGVFLLAELYLRLDIFWCTLVAAMFAELSAQLLARVVKAPSTLLRIPFVVPLIPGSALYNTTRSLVSSDLQQFSKFGITTVLFVLGISFGIGISASLFTLVSRFKKRKKLRT